jgi:hypothetical protein
VSGTHTLAHAQQLASGTERSRRTRARTWQQPHFANTLPLAHACGLIGLMFVAPQRLHTNFICVWIGGGG